MTVDELKGLLLDENIDAAAKVDTVLDDYSKRLYEIEELTRKSDELTDRVNQLTETNLKLLDKVKYAEDDSAKESKDDTDVDGEDISIADLFSDEEE